LTGLANRALFLDRIDHALMQSLRDPERIGVLFIDLDDFKAINDTQGHAAGDLVLQRVASALLNATRGCDTVSRLGGDEFAVLLERVNHSEGPEVAAQRIVNALAKPIETAAGRMVTVGVSIGIAMQKSGEDRDEVLRNADVALYEAKTRSRGRWVVYDPAMHAALVDKVSLEADLRVAIERCLLSLRPGLEKTGRFPRFGDSPTQSQISLAYQPIVEMDSETLTGFEALLRWNHPERGLIAPATFVPIAEESGLVLALGRWVLRTACLQAAAWNARRPTEPLTVTVNLSGRQLQDDSLTIDVESALKESGLPASRLVLEMTESVIMHESAAARKRLVELKQLGVRLAIDDFGTGYSSLSHLQQFPVDILKIDQSFLHRMHQGSQDAALVRTIITLAKLLSLRTIAEGVEDAEQQERLKELGCDSAQGFLFGRPMPVAEIDSLLSVSSDLR
jgi:diguanylate cyclase (GGDEF)-like protein